MTIQKHCPHAVNKSIVSCVHFKGTINITNLKMSPITGPFTHTNIKQCYFVNMYNITQMEFNLQIDFINPRECRALVKTRAQIFKYMTTDVPRSLTGISNVPCNGIKDRQMGRIVSCASINTKNNDLTKTQTQCNRNSNLPNHKKGLLSQNNKLNFEFKGNGLHVAYVNIQHLLPKLDEITCKLAENNSVDIFGMVETFLHNDVADNTLRITNFNIERNDRLHKRGGGVIVYIKNNITYRRRYDLESEDIECICLEIKFPTSKPFIIIFMYRPPNSTQCWIDKFEKQMEAIDFLNMETHIIGDFNINYSPNNNINKFSNSKWENAVLNLGFSQLVEWPTRVTEKTSSIIDHLYTSRPDLICNVTVPNYCISDHFPVLFSRTLKNKPVKGCHKHIKYRSFKSFNEQQFYRDLLFSELHNIEQIDNPVKGLGIFYDILTSILDKHAPIKEKRIKYDKQPEWLTNEIKEAMLNRDLLHKKKLFNEYKIQRNKTLSMIKKVKRIFITDLYQKIKVQNIFGKALTVLQIIVIAMVMM